jgi:hypothetical protein
MRCRYEYRFVSPATFVRRSPGLRRYGYRRSVRNHALARTPGIWTDSTSGRVYPEAFSLLGLLLSREPSSVTEPRNLPRDAGAWRKRAFLQSTPASRHSAPRFVCIGFRYEF